MMNEGLYLLLTSVHGLIRGHDMELGRDPDTGGQTKYVVELTRALAQQPEVERVDLLTRLIIDDELSEDYGQAVEPLSEKAQIVRLPAGPSAYIRKEELWDHLDTFADNAVAYLRSLDRLPNVIHSHYADAGYVGLRLANLLGIPLVHTGHSLGRVKRRRLLARGVSRGDIESRYNISRRIQAEEDTLATAQLVIASTHNEIEDQYGLYDYYQPDHMAVVPPGIDLKRFHPPVSGAAVSTIGEEIARFLSAPDRPMILALSRPDERKNLATLIEAYGESKALQDIANLVIVAGNREDIRDMDAGPQSVFNEMLVLIDTYDLYGRVAYPKQHRADDVPEVYRLAAVSGGVFINPALTEPFGLTLIEAAASGLPIVATEDGGPRDIIGNCHNGLLVNPLDKQAIANALLEVLRDREHWQRFAANGVDGVHAHYAWQAHAARYLELIAPFDRQAPQPAKAPLPKRYLADVDRAVLAELDQALLGDPAALKELIGLVRRHRASASFGIVTGRGLEPTLRVLKKHAIPLPDVLITGMGTEIFYAPRLSADIAWTHHIDHQWNRKALRRILDPLPGLELQAKDEQLKFKLSYFIDPQKAPSITEINSLLYQEEETVNVLMSFGQYLDILPVRASKGFALRYFAHQWDIPLERILVAGGTRGDEDMMRGNALGVVVSNPHHEELSQLTDVERVYFSKAGFAAGILEAIDHYDFYGECRAPEDD